MSFAHQGFFPQSLHFLTETHKPSEGPWQQKKTSIVTLTSTFHHKGGLDTRNLITGALLRVVWRLNLHWSNRDFVPLLIQISTNMF